MGRKNFNINFDIKQKEIKNEEEILEIAKNFLQKVLKLAKKRKINIVDIHYYVSVNESGKSYSFNIYTENEDKDFKLDLEVYIYHSNDNFINKWLSIKVNHEEIVDIKIENDVDINVSEIFRKVMILKEVEKLKTIAFKNAIELCKFYLSRHDSNVLEVFNDFIKFYSTSNFENDNNFYIFKSVEIKL